MRDGEVGVVDEERGLGEIGGELDALLDDQGSQRIVFGVGPNAAIGLIADGAGQACWSADSSRDSGRGSR